MNGEHPPTEIPVFGPYAGQSGLFKRPEYSRVYALAGKALENKIASLSSVKFQDACKRTAIAICLRPQYLQPLNILKSSANLQVVLKALFAP